MTIVDWILNTAETHPEAEAVVEGGADNARARVVTYGQIAEAIARGRKRAQIAEVQIGDRCGLIGVNGADFILNGLEIMAAGGCLFPISAAVTGETLDGLVRWVKLHHVVREGGWVRRDHPGSVDGADDVIFRQVEPAYIRFTSGTTNTNKGVVLGQAGVVERIRAANQALRIGPTDRVLWVLPMAHHWVVSILLYLAHGACVVVPRAGGTAGAWALARSEAVTVMYASPHDYVSMVEGAEAVAPRGLRLAVSTAVGLTPAVAGGVAARLGVPLTQALGVIEAGLPAVNTVHAADKPLSVGRAVPGYEIWLRDETGARIEGRGEGHLGEICVSGPGLFAAYLDPWTLAPSDYFATGDQGYFDLDGDLFVLGRRRNRISSGGMKFFCEEVEAAVERHPAVQAARVMGQAHPQYGEVPVVEMEVRDGTAAPDVATLAAFLKPTLPPHMIPVQVRVVETLARTPTGKLRRW
jgi:long-chain acyl-CoA synthetase